LWSRTMKHSWPSFMSGSSTDHGGGKRRVFISLGACRYSACGLS
jgi:hypothetical protein